MSTCCRIARKDSSGSYESIYCHNDGYPKYMLPMLRTCYNSEVRVAELIDNGDASSIQEKLFPTKKHTFDDPQDGVCIFYNRDRGEPWDEVAPIRGDSKQALIRSSADYVYIFEDGAWTCYSNGRECF